MNKRTIRIIALLLTLCAIFTVVSISVFASESDISLGKESAPMSAAVPSRSIAVFANAFTIMRCVEYLGKTMKSVNAVAVAVKEDKSFAEICDIAIDAFLGRERDDDVTDDDSDEKYAMMSAEIKAIHSKLTDLESGIDEINASIQELNNTIIAEANKEYVNDFRKDYIDLANDMVNEYEQLAVTLSSDNKSIDSVKRDYDDLYIASVRLNDMLYEYMTGSYRDDGLSIYEVMYDYVDATSGKSLDEINERCIGFSEELYATYALSQYYRLLCGIYQMEYCDYYNRSSYVTENEAPESLPRDSIVTALTRMESRYETIVTDVARYVVSCGKYNMNMIYVPAVTAESYSVAFGELRNTLYAGDRYYFASAFPKELEVIFLDTPLVFETTDATIATVGAGGELVLTGNVGNFALLLKYGDNVVANYPFSVRESTVAPGYGIESSPYLVSTAEEFLAATKNTAHVKLINNISLSGTTYNNYVIGGLFGGVLDGNGRSIANVAIKDTGDPLVGFFRQLSSSAVVKNLSLMGVTITKGDSRTYPCHIGILCAYNSGKIYNCTVENARITFQNFTTTTPYRLYVGGVAGINYGTIENTMSRGFIFNANSVKFESFIGKSYEITIGGLVGSSGTNAVLRNNLVKNANITYSALFIDTYNSGAPSISNSIGLVVGNRVATADEALYDAGTLNGSVRSEIYLTNNPITSTLELKRYKGTDVRSVDDTSDYRVLDGSYVIDREVYSELVLVRAPQEVTVPYGGVLNLSGISLIVRYANGMTARVPVSAVSGFDPTVYGEQTVTLSYSPNVNNVPHTLKTDITVTVVCSEHEWVLDSFLVPNTCITDGSVRNVCSLCGVTAIVSTVALGHNYQSEVTPPTCLDGGFTTHTCSRCSSSYVDTHTTASGHTPGSAATCTTAQTCTVCNTVIVTALGHKPGSAATCTTSQTCTACNTVIKSALGHKPGSAATCTTAQTCTVCNETLNTALGHNYKSEVTPPTCLDGGFTTHTCSRCSSSYVDTHTTASGHTPGSAATCTAAQTCTVCNTVIVTALGHKPSSAATCTAAQTCTVCNETLNTALGHNYKSEVTPPTCLDGGFTTHTCSRCSSSYVDTHITASGHKAGSAATCTTAQTCTVCNTVLASALGHTAGAPATCTTAQTCVTCSTVLTTALGHKPGSAATCTTAQTCTVCNETLNTALGHNYKSEVTPPSCLDGGFTTHTCLRCSSSYVDTHTTASGHTPGSAATCTTAQTCTVCNETLNTALGHNYKSEVTPPTCLDGGFTTHTCFRCSSSYVDTHTTASGHTSSGPATCDSAEKCTVCKAVLNSALGHEYDVTVTPPTCTKQGYSTYACVRCDSSYLDNYTAPTGHTLGDAPDCISPQICTTCSTVIASALGHDYENETFTATCLAKGFTMHTCTRCQHSYNDGFSEKTDHSASDWIIDVSPTVGASGSEHTECIFCHAVLERRDIAPLVSDSDTLPDTEVNENGENEKKEMKAWEIALVSFGGTSGAIGVFGGSFLLIRRRIRRRAMR